MYVVYRRRTHWAVQRRARSPVCVAEENANDCVREKRWFWFHVLCWCGPPTQRRRRRLWRARARPRTGVRPPSHAAHIARAGRRDQSGRRIHGADQWARCGVHPVGSAAVPFRSGSGARAADRRRNRCDRIIVIISCIII